MYIIKNPYIRVKLQPMLPWNIWKELQNIAVSVTTYFDLALTVYYCFPNRQVTFTVLYLITCQVTS